MTRRIAVAGALALGFASSSALAQSNDAALAETLYRQGRELMSQGKANDACPKFAESQRLDPATGTALNLAACYEAVGKLASAWLTYTDAALAARRDQREDRVRFAEERIALLEPKLSRLTVSVAKGADAPDLAVRLNGASLGPAARGVPSPVDPGTYQVEATAPGKKPWRGQVVVGKEADHKTILVPALAPAPVNPSTEGATVAFGTRDALATERPVSTPVYIAGGVTLALVAASGATGILFWQRKSDFDDANENPNSNPDELNDLRDRASSMSIVSSALAAGAVVGAGLTVGLYLTRPERPHEARAARPRPARLSPVVCSAFSGLVFSGEL